MIRRTAIVAGAMMLFGASAGAQSLATPPAPIPSVAVPPPPQFVGSAARPHPIRGIPVTPHNPFMAPNGQSEIHDDGWQTDVNTWGGPLGRSPKTLSSEIQHDCGSITFDRQGRVVSVCVGVGGPELYMFDPTTLATLATYMLPTRQDVPSNVFQDFTGGGYFYLDNQDRVVTSTTTKHILVIAENPGAPGFTLVHDYPLTSVLTSSEKITSALPDSHGLLWFVARVDGVVGTLNLATGTIHSIHLGSGAVGEIENSFATDQPDDSGAAQSSEAGSRARGKPEGGVYIATNRKLYRFGAGRGGVPKIVWQITYPNSGQSKPGQVDDGTGTTPTVMPGGYVNITDNADPMDIMVYRTAARPTKVIRRHGRRDRVLVSRTVCRVPIFSKGSSADENSIISAGRSMIAEDNYGYTGPPSIEGKVTTPGFVRVDLNASGNGCHRVWTNTTESAPTVVSKLSLATGLVYTYTTDTSGNWYWTALDFATGKTVYKAYSGTGFGFNNNYAGISISPRGVEYLGSLGGIIALRDGG